MPVVRTWRGKKPRSSRLKSSQCIREQIAHVVAVSDTTTKRVTVVMVDAGQGFGSHRSHRLSAVGCDRCVGPAKVATASVRSVWISPSWVIFGFHLVNHTGF